MESSSAVKPVIIGTAGHIDHGKTALVRALTGIDADRLKEEKRRGITIDIGFAHMELPDPQGKVIRFGFVDVPGHERFVRNMLAGVGGIDMVLLVVAADESIMPQTREHFDICRLLAVPCGITALTKSDLVDNETLDVVRLEVEEYLSGSFLDPRNSPIIPVSAYTGAGLDLLKDALVGAAASIPSKDATRIARLPIDRVFIMKGFGTVVTGTLIAGSIHKEQELEVFPGGRRVRVRGIQIHNRKVDAAAAGQRTALNLSGVDAQDLGRGMMLAPPDLFRATHCIEAHLSLLPSSRPLPHRARVHFYAHAGEAVAEAILHSGKQLLPGETGYVQLRLTAPMLLLPGDRFILRQLSPVVTIGGGVLLDAAPPPRRRKLPSEEIERHLGILHRGAQREILMARILRRGKEGIAIADIIAETGWRREQVDALLSQLSDGIARYENRIIAKSVSDDLQLEILARLNKYHDGNPLSPGMAREELRERMHLTFPVFAGILETLAAKQRIQSTGEFLCVAGRGVAMRGEEESAKEQIEQTFLQAGLQTPLLKDVLAGLAIDKVRARKILYLLLREKTLVQLDEDIVFHRQALENLRRRLADFKNASDRISIPQFKEMAGVTRRYAMALVEYLDHERVTRRVGDERIIL